MSIALKKAMQIIEDLKKADYPDEVISAELRKAGIKQGDYIVHGYSGPVFSTIPELVYFFTNDKSFDLTIENYKKVKEIAKLYDLGTKVEHYYLDYFISLRKGDEIVAGMSDKSIAINPSYEKTGELLEKIGSELYGMTTQERMRVKKGKNIKLVSREDFQALIVSLMDLPSLWTCATKINDLIKDKVGELKVKEADFQVVNGIGRVDAKPIYKVPLAQYIEVAKSFFKDSEIFNQFGNKFDVGYWVDAWNVENPQKVLVYRDAKRKQKSLSESKEPVYVGMNVIDVEKTKELLSQKIQELEPEVPEVLAHLFALRGHAFLEFPVLWFSSRPIKESGKQKSSEIMEELLKIVKDYEGPRLNENADEKLMDLYNLITNPEISELLPPTPHVRGIIDPN